MSVSVIVFILCVLVATINIVNCDIQLDCKQDRFILEENTPFKLRCTATDTKKNVLTNMKFVWFHDGLSASSGRIKVEDGGSNTIVTTTSDDKKTITSILTVRKPPLVLGRVFYYYADLIELPKNKSAEAEQSTPFRLFKETSLPTPNVTVPVFTATFKDKVMLVCQVNYDNTNINTQDKYEFVMSWRKGKILLQSKPMVYKNGKNTEYLNLTITVRKSNNGGEYSCLTDFYKIDTGRIRVIRTSNMTLKISPQINGESEKEVKEVAGKDVDLHCDIIGYPITYEWLNEKKEKIHSDSRIKIYKHVLSIDDITYGDRKKYICVGKLGDNELQQVIILRVKDPYAPLWPFIGILIEAVLIAVIIYASYYFKSKRGSKTDGDADRIIEIDPAASSTNN